MTPKPLIIIDTGIIGGPGRGLLQLLKGLQERSLEYLLCTFEYQNPKSTEFADEVRRCGLTHCQVKQRGRLDPSPIWKVLKIAREGNFKIIQSHGYKSHVIAAIVSKILRIPWVAFAHGWTAEDSKVKVYHSLDKLLLRWASAVIAVSPPLFELFTRLRDPKRSTHLVLNAVDAEAIPGKLGATEIRSRCGVSTGDFLIGCIGRLSFEKGQDTLLRAFAGIADEHPRAKLVLLGDGASKNELEKTSSDLGVAGRVIFAAHERFIRDWYEAIDLLVLPSRSEGLPNVVLEAMSFSVPVVATPVGAVPEIISQERNGWIASESSAEALTKSLRTALSDARQLKEIGRQGKLSLTPKFCPNTRVEKILGIYSEVLS